MEELIQEIRNEKNIPPYVPDEKIKVLINQSNAFFSTLVPGCDYETDLTCRELLKERVYYAYSGVLDAFKTNYQTDILTWQLNTEVTTDED